jgi:hypothetical protein
MARLASILAATIILAAAAKGMAEEPFWAILPGEGMGTARLGLAQDQIESALAEIPCPRWAFTTDFDRSGLVSIGTACGGAVRLESGVQVGSAFEKVVRQFGKPDLALITEDAKYDQGVAYWIPYPDLGIAFRVVVYGGDVTVQSIRVMRASVVSAEP